MQVNGTRTTIDMGQERKDEKVDLYVTLRSGAVVELSWDKSWLPTIHLEFRSHLISHTGYRSFFGCNFKEIEDGDVTLYALGTAEELVAEEAKWLAKEQKWQDRLMNKAGVKVGERVRVTIAEKDLRGVVGYGVKSGVYVGEVRQHRCGPTRGSIDCEVKDGDEYVCWIPLRVGKWEKAEKRLPGLGEKITQDSHDDLRVATGTFKLPRRKAHEGQMGLF